MNQELQDKVDAIILEAAKQELKWDAKDDRFHNHKEWKTKVRKKLWEEFKVDLEIYC